MRAMLDTNAFLWFISDSKKLGANARNCIADRENVLFLSIASLWEIAIKSSLGKLEMLLPFDQLIPEQLEINSINILPIEIIQLSRLIQLPFYHRDPFDRMIIAQCISEGLPVVSSDESFQKYPIDIIW